MFLLTNVELNHLETSTGRAKHTIALSVSVQLIITIDKIPNPGCISLKIILLFPCLFKYNFSVSLMRKGINFSTAGIHLLWAKTYGRSYSVPILSLGLKSHCALSFSTLPLCLHFESQPRPAGWQILETQEEMSHQPKISMSCQLPANPLSRNNGRPRWDQTRPD